LPKRNFASVTQIPCRCNYLQRQANHPDSPIVFDERTNEFHIVHRLKSSDESAKFTIYHCPFCGGAAPASKRDTLFAVVSHAETARLQEQLKGIRTVDDAIAVLGPADHDEPFGTGSGTLERDGVPPIAEYYRTLTYTKLSDVADVVITDYHRDRVGIAFRGKYLGK
jgi:hypothetical protein